MVSSLHSYSFGLHYPQILGEEESEDAAVENPLRMDVPETKKGVALFRFMD